MSSEIEDGGIPAATKYWGSEAWDYDSVRESKPGFWRDQKIIEQIVEQFTEESVIADIPCGTGRAAFPILKRGHYYVGVDVSDDMLRVADEKLAAEPFRQHARLLQGSAMNLPLNESEVDHIVSVKFFKWLPTDDDIRRVLREFQRVCSGSVFLNLKERSASQEGGALSIRQIRRRVGKGLRQLPPIAGTPTTTTAPRAQTRSLWPGRFQDLADAEGWHARRFAEHNGVVWYRLDGST